MHYLHERDVVHRDVSLENWLVKTVGGKRQPFLMDYGQAMRRVRGARGRSGKPFYQTEEVVRNVERDDDAFDVWCLGMCLYIMLVGCE